MPLPDDATPALDRLVATDPATFAGQHWAARRC